MIVEEYLNTFFKGTKNPSLEAVNYFMDLLNHPEKKLKIIHIAGTNGKGSCTEMMTSILVQAGYQVGKFLSPHLIHYNERISINQKMITNQELEQLIYELQPEIEKYNEEHETKVTLFELETIMAILYFYRKHCNFVVMEVGLGGLYDATNVVTGIVSIINSIGYDHMHILGNTLEEIATEKAGIIKQGKDTVFIEQEEGVNQIIQKTCETKQNQLHFIQKSEIKNNTYTNDFQTFDFRKYTQIKVNLKGEKQIYNASLCLETISILQEKYQIEIPEEAIRKGLETVIHRGRFETIYEHPTIIYDGAHNEAAIRNFKKSVEMYYPKEKKIYVVSILKNKDYETILKELMTDKKGIFFFTDGNNKERYVPKETLYETANKIGKYQSIQAKSLEETIMEMKKVKEEIVFIIGSFYIYGNVLELLSK